MLINLNGAIALITGVLFSAGSVNAQEAAGIDRGTPSITYYGSGLNERIDERQYRAKQQQPNYQQYRIEGQQGQHLARMEEAKRQRTATGYGDVSTVTGNRRMTFVNGYTRADGKRVRSYYKSNR